MVVDESIKVKKLVFIEGVVHCDRLVDKLSGPCDGHEMDGTKDTANMDDCNVSESVIPEFWLNHPTACIFVGLGTHEGIPLNVCTLILLVVMQK